MLNSLFSQSTVNSCGKLDLQSSNGNGLDLLEEGAREIRGSFLILCVYGIH